MIPRKAIIYDSSCPMCRWYTDEFVKAKLLDQHNRIAFAELENKGLVDKIDLDRSRDEIPLVDLDGGETRYGIDSLVYLLAPRFPFIPRFLAIRPINWFFRHLYKFVSYNRRVMAPGRKVEQQYDCTPHFDWKYRWYYVLFSLSVGWFGLGTFCLAFLPNLLWLLIVLFFYCFYPIYTLRRKRQWNIWGRLVPYGYLVVYWSFLHYWYRQ